jgi:hypothetical protein
MVVRALWMPSGSLVCSVVGVSVNDRGSNSSVDRRVAVGPAKGAKIGHRHTAVTKGLLRGVVADVAVADKGAVVVDAVGIDIGVAEGA